MHRAVSMFVMLAMCAVASAAFAAEADEVVVTGRRPPAAAREAATAYVRALGMNHGSRPVARWIASVCPTVLNAEPAAARIVEARIRAVARDAHAPVAAAGCRPNIVVSFAHDTGGLVERIAARDRQQFGEVPAAERQALSAGSIPVRWWYRTEDRGQHGEPLFAGDPPFVSVGGAGAGSVLPSNPRSRVQSQYSSTIVGTQTIRVIQSATILVDVDAAAGIRLDAVADYAAMVALAEVHRAESPPPGSILALFDADPRPQKVSGLDAAFLRRLYSLPLDRTARLQQGMLIGALMAER